MAAFGDVALFYGVPIISTLALIILGALPASVPVSVRTLILALGATSLLAIVAGGYAISANAKVAEVEEQLSAASAKAKSEWETAEAKLRVQAEIDAAAHRAMVYGLAGITKQQQNDPQAIHLAIRAYVHRSRLAGLACDSSSRVIKANLCVGLGGTLTWMLNKVGIPARVIRVAGRDFLEGKNRNQTLLISEVQLGGKWQLSDPIFNISVDCSDGKSQLSVAEAVQCLSAGHKLAPVPGIDNGNPVKLPTAYPSYLAAYTRGTALGGSISLTPEYYPNQGWQADALAKYK